MTRVPNPIEGARKARPRLGKRRWLLFGMALVAASPAPMSRQVEHRGWAPGYGSQQAVALSAELSDVVPDMPSNLTLLTDTLLINLRLASPDGQAGAGGAIAGRTPLDQLRAETCLAQAIYYEAANEPERGQRAVAQVVLNRMRHPAWPNSVCGVVFQGPLRAGGGCQFTFTCDGSMARRPEPFKWEWARRLAAEALAGYVHAEVGTATHYHASYVSPRWAPHLRPAGVIGLHRFYRLPGAWGDRAAFTAAYTGSEPATRPRFTLMRRTAGQREAARASGRQYAGAQAPSRSNRSRGWGSSQAAASEPPPSTVREEFRHSGQWRPDAPAAITGR
ncbi:MAG: cell wall hydrolase [Sphingosinicella sp.]